MKNLLPSTCLAFVLLTSPALCVDDLIYQPGTRITSARSLSWNGRVYGNVQVISWTSKTFVIASKQGPAQIPITAIPSLWKKVLDKESPPMAMSPELEKWEKERTAFEVTLLNGGDPFVGKSAEKQNLNFAQRVLAWEASHPRPVK